MTYRVVSGITHTSRYELVARSVRVDWKDATKSQWRTMRQKAGGREVKLVEPGRGFRSDTSHDLGTLTTYLQRRHIPHSIHEVQKWIATYP